jgi:DNA-binding transcriptional regulator YiaG
MRHLPHSPETKKGAALTAQSFKQAAHLFVEFSHLINDNRTVKKHRDFAGRLMAWRKANNLGRHAAAEELQISKRTLQDWEQRRRSPRLVTAETVLARLIKDGF